MFAAEDRIVGLDFDGVRNPRTGAIKQDTLDWLNIFDSYSEVSPSLTGVKVWIRGELDRARRKGGIEVYPFRRFFTVTGQRLEDFSAAVEERQEALDAFVDWHFPPLERRESGGPVNGEKIDLPAFLEDAGVEILVEMHDSSAETKFGIVCPWVDEHTGGDDSGTRTGQYADGALFFHCEHSHCAERRWREFRDKVAPRIPGWKRYPKILISGKVVNPYV